MSQPRRESRRVLIVLPNWLGDVVMATGLLDLLSAAGNTGAIPLELFACVRRAWAPLLEDDPRLAGVVPYERQGRHAGYRGAMRLAAAWRELAADAVVLCPPSLRVALVARLAGIPRRVGFPGDGRGWLLTRSVGPVRARGVQHHADELRQLGNELLAILDMPLPAAAPGSAGLPGLDGVAAVSLGEGPPVWVLAPGATYGSAKAWPPSCGAEFLRLAVRERGVRVAVVGDEATSATTIALRERTADLPWRQQIAGPAGVVDLTGTTSLLELVGLLRAASAFLGNDSGVMHLAAAIGLPTLGLFGSSSVAWTAPQGRRAAALAAQGFACQPCFRRECNNDAFCLETLTAAEVLSNLENLMRDEVKEDRR